MKTEKSIIDEVISDLNSRNKELECLFNVDEILSNYEIPLEETANQLINNIPNGFRQSQICVVRIEIEGKVIQSSDFLMTEISPVVSNTHASTSWICRTHAILNCSMRFSFVRFDESRFDCSIFPFSISIYGELAKIDFMLGTYLYISKIAD